VDGDLVPEAGTGWCDINLLNGEEALGCGLVCGLDLFWGGLCHRRCRGVPASGSPYHLCGVGVWDEERKDKQNQDNSGVEARRFFHDRFLFEGER